MFLERLKSATSGGEFRCLHCNNSPLCELFWKSGLEIENQILTSKEERIRRELKPNTKILYYIGDREAPQQKWRQRWSGPWQIRGKVIDDSTVEIVDPQNGNSKWVSVDRIKLYRKNDPDMISWMQYNNELLNHQQRIQQRALLRHQL